jgi:hypothetical protein
MTRIFIFCNRSLDKFAYGPSIGASGGFITIWKGTHFDAEVVEQNLFGHTILFRSKLTGQVWWLTNIYAHALLKGERTFFPSFLTLKLMKTSSGFFLVIST